MKPDQMSNMPEAQEANASRPAEPAGQPKPKKKKSFWKWFFGILGGCGFFLLLCGLCFYITAGSRGLTNLYEATPSYTHEVAQGTGDDIVAVIDISGYISDFGTGITLEGSSMTSAEEINKMIDYAVEDQKAGAILFRVNSPGGNLTAAETICQRIRVAKQNGIYTMAWIHTMGTSGGYYIASCTDWIITREDAMTGSIGVVIEAMDVNAFLENIGFRVRTLANTNSEYKTGEDIFEEGSETEKQIREILDENYEQFIDVIVEGRKGKKKDLSRAEILRLADGRVFSGSQAVENGLVDEAGYEGTAVNSVIDKAGLSSDATVIIIKPQEGFWGQLATSAINKLKPPVIDAQMPGIQVLAVYEY